MRNITETSHVKGDYLIRLGGDWCRGDTDSVRVELFFARAARSARLEAALERKQRVDALSCAHFDRATRVDEDLARTRPRIVMGGDRHAVGARRQDREEVSFGDREVAIHAQHV